MSALPGIRLIANWTIQDTLPVVAPYVDGVCWENFAPSSWAEKPGSPRSWMMGIRNRLAAEQALLLGHAHFGEQYPADAVELGQRDGSAEAVRKHVPQALLEGKKMDDAIRFAHAAAAIAVTRKGAQPSVPWRKEIDEFLSQQG